ncbi:hypothetical protein AAMO2058_000897700 [Amorphochlora amoebiformis]
MEGNGYSGPTRPKNFGNEISPKVVKNKMDVLPYLPREKTPKDDLVDAESALLNEQKMLALQIEDVSTLLRMQFNTFVSYIAFEPSVLKFVDTYLCHARGNLDSCKQGEDLLPLEEELAKKVLILLYRLTASPETQHCQANLGSLFYNNWVFDSPKLLDISRIFANSNPEHTRKIIEAVFNMQGEYWTDLDANLSATAAMLSDICEQYEKPTQPSQHLPKGGINPTDALTRIEEIYLTLGCFVDVNPKASPLFIKHKFIQMGVIIVERVIPVLLASLHSSSTASSLQQIGVVCSHFTSRVLFHRYVATKDTKKDAKHNKGKSKSGMAMYDVCARIIEGVPSHEADKKARGVLRTGYFLSTLAKIIDLKDIIEAGKTSGLLQQEQASFLFKSLEVKTKTEVSKSVEEKRDCITRLVNIFGFSKDFADLAASNYGYNAEKVTAAVLDHSLPLDLRAVKNPRTFSKGSVSRSVGVSKAKKSSRKEVKGALDSVVDDDDRKLLKGMVLQYCNEYEDEPDDGLDGFEAFDVGDAHEGGGVDREKKAKRRMEEQARRMGRASRSPSPRDEKRNRRPQTQNAKNPNPNPNPNPNSNPNSNPSKSFRGRRGAGGNGRPEGQGRGMSVYVCVYMCMHCACVRICVYAL